jgi:hypothetical protein
VSIGREVTGGGKRTRLQAMNARWNRDDLIIRREVLGLQPVEVATATAATGVWLEAPVFVVDDSPEHLVTYMAPSAPFRFPVGSWPTPDGRHPWHGRSGWQGNGCLMVQRPGEHHAVWHFWNGPDREFVSWYLNLQTAFVRTADGYDTQDLELDLVVFPDGSHIVKDDEVLDDRVSEGRYSPELVTWVRHYGQMLVRRLEADGPWWDQSWAAWEPDPDWTNPAFPDA